VSRTPLRKLWLPFDCLETLHEGMSEVRVYRNDVTGALQVGKRIETLGLEESVAVREATLLQGINHANLVKVLDVAEVADVAAPLRQIEMIMPYFVRGSLCDAFMAGESFSVETAVRCVSAALLGLAELHEVHGILHRDIKATNVFLADDESLMKVGDLSVATPLGEDGRAEPLAEAMLYSPPETFFAGRVGREADLYGLGLVLFEMVNGRLPYELYDRDVCSTRLQRRQRAVRDSDLVHGPHVPRGVRRVISKAISRDPEKRFQSAQQMSAALAGLEFIDWSLELSEPDLWRWSGRHVRHLDRSFRVTAQRKKTAGWVLKAEKRVNQWRRVLPDQVVPELTHPSASNFFDQLATQA
jgi:eukaryotic-like serine/threonine-protein kinase